MWTARELKAGEGVAIQQALVALEARQQPAESKRILWHIGRMLNHWGDRKSDQEKEMVIGDWVRLLSPFAEAHIIEACDQWLMREKYRPTIAEIVALIERAQARDRENVHRCRVLLQMETPRPWERLPPPPDPPAQPRNTAGLLASITRKLGVSRPPARGADVTGDVATHARQEMRLARDPEAVERLRQMRPITDSKSTET